MPSYLITGASRGIGFGLVEELVKQPDNFVIACARNPSQSTGLQKLVAQYPNERLATITIDYNNLETIDEAAKQATELLPNGLDYLINSAGLHLQHGSTALEDIDPKVFEEELRVNTFAPIRLVCAFLPLIRKGTVKKMVFMASQLGSVKQAAIFPSLSFTYSISKAGLNMLVRKFGAMFYSEGITVVLLEPGWVDTEMGQQIYEWIKAHFPQVDPITIEQSVAGSLKEIENAKCEQDIKWYALRDYQLPW